MPFCVICEEPCPPDCGLCATCENKFGDQMRRGTEQPPPTPEDIKTMEDDLKDPYIFGEPSINGTTPDFPEPWNFLK